MRFSEDSREDTEAHASAVERLERAQTAQRESVDARDAANDTSDEPVAASALARADEQLAAREAWVGWIERGY